VNLGASAYTSVGVDTEAPEWTASPKTPALLDCISTQDLLSLWNALDSVCSQPAVMIEDSGGSNVSNDFEQLPPDTSEEIFPKVRVTCLKAPSPPREMVEPPPAMLLKHPCTVVFLIVPP